MNDDRNATPGVRELACRLNNDGGNFDRAAEDLQRTTRIEISGESLRQLVELEGRAVLEGHRRGVIDLGFDVSDCVVKPTTRPTSQPTSQQPLQQPVVTRMYHGVDGVMVGLVTEAEKQQRRAKIAIKRRERKARGLKLKPLPKPRRGSDKSYKEFKVIRFYNDGCSRSHIILSACKRTATGKLIRRDAVRLGFQQATEKIGIVDGAAWIPPQLEAAELHLDGWCLDFYHLSENAHKARKAIFSESPAGTIWVEKFLHTIKHDGYAPARELLLELRTGLRGKRRAAADRLLDYVVDRRDMINYPEFAAKGWQIGSGPTEAACKTSTSRLKRSGPKWDADNAEAVAALTNLRSSGQWSKYWPNLPREFAATPTTAKT